MPYTPTGPNAYLTCFHDSPRSILLISALLTSKCSAIWVLLMPDASIDRIVTTLSSFNLAPGLFTPRRLTSPVSHDKDTFFSFVTHSRLAARLSVLSPLMWLTWAPSKYPGTNAVATSLWTRFLTRILSTYTARTRYPLQCVSRDNSLSGFFPLAGVPHLDTYSYWYPIRRTRPLSDTSNVPLYPRTSNIFHAVINAPHQAITVAKGVYDLTARLSRKEATW